MFNNYQKIAFDCDECMSKGICSLNPSLTSVQEVILLYLKELSFYLLKLKDFGVTNEKIKEVVTYAFFNIITDAEYKQEEFHNVMSKLYYFIEESKALYENFCDEKSIDIEKVKTYFKRSRNFDLTLAIKRGERYFLKKNYGVSIEQKNVFDIILFLVKSMFIKIIECQRLGFDDNKAFYDALKMLDRIHLDDFSMETVKEELQDFSMDYYDIVKNVFYAQIELYGPIETTQVSFSNEISKAILVSGSDYKKLENVLEATENLPIDVYTHGIEMLMAHAHPKMRAHPNLKGHFGTGFETSIIDFATFPGAILMTKGTLQRVEYLYRGRLFTLDPIAPMGIVRIKDNNYEPLIKSALQAKGFTKVHRKPDVKVGFSEIEINNKVDEILEKYEKKEIENLIFIGLLNYPSIDKSYFDNFLEAVPKNCYVISLCHEKNSDNIFHFDSYFDYSLFYLILKKLSEKASLADLNITVFLTKCDKHTLANLIYLSKIGVKNIYMCKCPSTLMNPSLLNTMRDLFDIKEFSNAREDLNNILK